MTTDILLLMLFGPHNVGAMHKMLIILYEVELFGLHRECNPATNSVPRCSRNQFIGKVCLYESCLKLPNLNYILEEIIFELIINDFLLAIMI